MTNIQKLSIKLIYSKGEYFLSKDIHNMDINYESMIILLLNYDDYNVNPIDDYNTSFSVNVIPKQEIKYIDVKFGILE